MNIVDLYVFKNNIMSQDNLITLYSKDADEHVVTKRNKKKFANADKLSLVKLSKSILFNLESL